MAGRNAFPVRARERLPLRALSGGLLALALSLGTAGGAAAEVCFLRGQQTFGMTITCIYDCFGQERRLTVSSLSICPLTIGEPQARPSGAGELPRPEEAPSAGAPQPAQPGAVPPTTLGQPPPTLPTLPPPPGRP